MVKSRKLSVAKIASIIIRETEQIRQNVITSQIHIIFGVDLKNCRQMIFAVEQKGRKKMGKESCIICTAELNDGGKEAVESLRRCYNETIDEHNAIVNWYKEQIEWYQRLVEHLMKIIERREEE